MNVLARTSDFRVYKFDAAGPPRRDFAAPSLKWSLGARIFAIFDVFLANSKPFPSDHCTRTEPIGAGVAFPNRSGVGGDFFNAHHGKSLQGLDFGLRAAASQIYLPLRAQTSWNPPGGCPKRSCDFLVTFCRQGGPGGSVVAAGDHR